MGHSSNTKVYCTHRLNLHDFICLAVDITYDIFDIAMRRLRQLDCDMSFLHNVPPWRLFLESDFAVCNPQLFFCFIPTRSVNLLFLITPSQNGL